MKHSKLLLQKALCLAIFLCFAFSTSAQIKVSLLKDTIDSVKLEGGLTARYSKPLKIDFDKRIVIYVHGLSEPFEKPDSARIYINNVLMPYHVVYNCPCENTKDTTKKFFTLTCTLGPHDTTWNRWYGFGDKTLKVKLDAGTSARPYTCTQEYNLELIMYSNGSLVFSCVVVGLFFILTLLLIFWPGVSLIKDQSTATPKPYSLSRFQLLWWTFIIISSYILLFAIRDDFGLLSQSTLILLGISAAGTGFSQLVDYSDSDKDRHQDQPGKNFFYDILSDNNGISVHRYQNFIFTIVFGIVFVYKVLSTGNMPNFGVLELSLMGLSTATYVGLKTNENNNTSNAATGTNGQPGPNDNIVG